MNIDRIFEHGVSDLSHEPRQMLTDVEIASAASAAKTGVGIWLLSHAKELLIGVASFAVGVGGTLLVTQVSHNEAPSQLPAEQTALVTTDSLSEETLSADTAIFAAESSEQIVVEPGSQTSTASSSSKASSPKRESVKMKTPEATVTSTTSEPVVIKKTVVQRDTVQINETVVVKDTVYIEN